MHDMKLYAIPIFVVLFSFPVLLSGCDSLGLTSDPPTVTISAELTAPDKTNLSGCEIAYKKNGSEKTFQSCSAEKSYTKAADQTIQISGRADTYEPTKQTVSLSADRSVKLNLSPDSVSVTIQPKDAAADTAVAGDIYLDGELIAENTSETTTQVRKATSLISGRVESPYFTEDSRQFEVTPDQNRDITVGLKRRSVTIDISLQTTAKSADLSAATIKIFEPNKADSVSCTGSECRKDLPKRSGQRSVQVTNQDTHPETGDTRRYGPYTTAFVADKDWSKSVTLEALSACSDGIDNEVGDDDDGLVDVWQDSNGDGRPSKGDDGDPGCTGPQDDNEGHRIFTRTTTRLNENLSISSSQGNQKQLIIDRSNISLPSSVQDAVGDLLVSTENKRDADESGEAFRLEFNAGPEDQLGNVTSTRTVADSDTINGWHFANARDIDKTSFATGTYYTITAVYAGPTDQGIIDIIFLIDGGEGRTTVLSYAYQEEDQEKSKQSVFAQTSGDSEDCQTVRNKKICTKTAAGGYVR